MAAEFFASSSSTPVGKSPRFNNDSARSSDNPGLATIRRSPSGVASAIPGSWPCPANAAVCFSPSCAGFGRVDSGSSIGPLSIDLLLSACTEYWVLNTEYCLPVSSQIQRALHRLDHFRDRRDLRPKRAQLIVEKFAHDRGVTEDAPRRRNWDMLLCAPDVPDHNLPQCRQLFRRKTEHPARKIIFLR